MNRIVIEIRREDYERKRSEEIQRIEIPEPMLHAAAEQFDQLVDSADLDDLVSHGD